MSYSNSNIETCIKNVGNKYALSVMVAKRIKDLSRTSPGLFSEGNQKELSYVLNEIADKKIISNMGN